jgi:hypothetical protein
MWRFRLLFLFMSMCRVILWWSLSKLLEGWRREGKKPQDWCSGGVQRSVTLSRWVVENALVVWRTFSNNFGIFHGIHQPFLPAKLL